MHVVIVGAGYVGLCTAAGLSSVGHTVCVVDTNENKIKQLQSGVSPIFEPGLEDLLRVNKSELSFTNTLDLTNVDVVLLAVGTPQGDDGAADLTYLFQAAKDVAKRLDLGQEVLILTKSTVPVGTRGKLAEIFKQHVGVTVGSNPEFLREGSAIQDVLRPDRIVVGLPDSCDVARATARDLYAAWAENLMFMNPESAELTKYGANAMLATRITFMNELGNLAEKTGADIRDVKQGVGSDSRIGPAFLDVGPGYGGSCVVGSTEVYVADGIHFKATPIEKLSTCDVLTIPRKLAVLAWRPGLEKAQGFPVSVVTRRPYDGDLYTVTASTVDSPPVTVRCTADHPFVIRVGGGWDTRLAADLKLGDTIPLDRVSSVEPTVITKITRTNYSGYVYSLEVPGAKMFVVNGGMIIHNCFPKDVKALLYTGRQAGVHLSVAEAADRGNTEQHRKTFEKIVAQLGGKVSDKRVAVLGLAFKPNTDDVRESPGILLAKRLKDASATVVCHDPNSMARDHARDSVRVVDDLWSCVADADAVIVATDWQDYRNEPRIALLSAPSATVFDLRNCMSDVKGIVVGSGRKYVGTGV